MQSFFGQAESFKAVIAYIQEKTKDIAKLQDKAVSAVRAKDEQLISQQLDKVLADGKTEAMKGKKILTQMLENEKGPESEVRIKRTIRNTLEQNFINSLKAFQKAQMQYKEKMKEKVARQVRIVKQDATMEEIDTAMRSGDTGALYRAAILQPGDDPIKQAYADVQSKYQDVLKLEESIQLLNQMYKDMALLVEKQGEMLDQIEIQVEETADYVEKGKDHVKGALVARKSIRKKYMIIAAIIIIVCLIIGLAVGLR